MTPDDERLEPDPSEVQPTDNSSGTPVDLERLEDLHDEAGPEGGA